MWQHHKSYIQSDLLINSTLHSYIIEFVFTISFIASKMIVFSNSFEFNMWQNIDLGQEMHTICCIWYAVHELIGASSPSWIFEALVPVPKVVGDVLVYVQANFWDTKQESQNGNKKFENSGRQGVLAEDCGVPRPAEARTEMKFSIILS